MPTKSKCNNCKQPIEDGHYAGTALAYNNKPVPFCDKLACAVELNYRISKTGGINAKPTH